MRKRIVLTHDQYMELVTSRDWCLLKGFTGMQRWYDEELAFQAGRYALPPGAVEYRSADDDERPVRPRKDY